MIASDAESVDSVDSVDSSDDTIKSSSGSIEDSSDSIDGGLKSSLVIPVGQAEDVQPDGHSCTYFARTEDSKCRKPRTCRSCLNAGVNMDKGGCVLTPMGVCRSMNVYDRQHDFWLNQTLERDYLFPAANTTYCAASDPACARCAELGARHQFAALTKPSVGNNKTYCIGKARCVCLAVCESPQWDLQLPDDCDPKGEDVSTYMSEKDNYRTFIPLFMVLQVALLGMLIYRRTLFFREARRPHAQREGPYNNVNAISSPSNRLELTGWRSMQEEQIDKERKRRCGVNLHSPPHQPEPPQQQPHESQRISVESGSMSLPILRSIDQDQDPDQDQTVDDDEMEATMLESLPRDSSLDQLDLVEDDAMTSYERDWDHITTAPEPTAVEGRRASV